MDSPFFYFVAMRVGNDISVSSLKKQAKNSFSRSAHVLICQREASWTIQRLPSWGSQWTNELWWHRSILHSRFEIWSSIYASLVTLYCQRCAGSVP